jgi:hypothetical protein
VRSGLVVGATFLDLQLAHHASNPRSPTELPGDDPVLSPSTVAGSARRTRLFRQLVVLQDEVEVAYTRMVSLSVDPPELEAAWPTGPGSQRY